MFGFVEADLNALSEAQQARYRGAYCGLCRALKERCGEVSRLTLSYDFVFLTLVLTGMYEPEEQAGSGRCLIHPVHPRAWWRSSFTDYAADMSVLMTWQKLMDDWNDERKLLMLAGAKLTKNRYALAAARWPVQARAIEDGLAELHAIEQSSQTDSDAPAICFGKLMGVLFDPKSDTLWGERLRRFGEALGQFIYMMDACVDLEQDRQKGSFNPLNSLNGGGVSEEEKLMLLKMLIGSCTAEFERLPLVQDAEIIRSVLYSGVWNQYAKKIRQEKGDAEGDQRSV